MQFPVKKISKKKLNNQELLNLFEPLGTMIHSGISVLEGLQLLKEDSEDQASQELLSSIIQNLEGTGYLAEALKNTGLFPESTVAYVSVGEETGCLDEVLYSLAKQCEQELYIASQIRSAVTYPLIMLGMMGMVIVLLLAKVLPVFQQVFRQMGMEMNGVSARLLHTGELISRYAIVFLFLLGVLILLLLWIVFTQKGRMEFKKLLFHLPYFKTIPMALEYGHLAQGMELGLRSGLGPETSVKMARMLINHPLIIEHLDKAAAMLEEGQMFTDAMIESGLFSGMDARMIHVGFHTGTMDDVMHSFTKRYLEQSMEQIEKAVAVIEPTIVILMSLLVGLVLLSVMIPLLGIMSGVMA